MKFLPLVWRNLMRRKVRTTFTLGSIFIAFVLFAFLMTIRTAFSMGVELAGVDRLMMMHKVSLLQLLPISYLKDIKSTPGVQEASHNTWFGGTYQDQANQFGVIAIDPEPYLRMYPEFRLPPEQVKAIALAFPGANEQWKHGGRVVHFYVGRKFFTWIRPEENSLVVRLDSLDERDALIESDPKLFHITDHYRSWPGVLVRLDRASQKLIKGMLARRFCEVATKKLLAQFEGKNGQ